MLTDFEVLSFLSSNNLRDYKSLNDYVKEYNTLQKRIEMQSSQKNNKAYQDKEYLAEMKRVGEVVWIQDKVKKYLEDLPAGNQSKESIEKFFKEAHCWDEEFELGPGPLSSQGVVLDKLTVNGVHSKAESLGMHCLGQIVMINGNEVKAALALKEAVDKATEKKETYKITVRGYLSPAEMMNLVNIRPDSGAQLHALIDSCDSRLSDERQDILLKLVKTVFKEPQKEPQAMETEPES